MQQDPIDDNSGRSPSVYVDNNPTNAVDPSGAVPFWVIAVIAVGLVLLTPGELNRNEDAILRQQWLEEENRRLRLRQQQLEEENRRLREEIERLKKQKGQGQGQRGQLNVPGGGNEVASAGIDGGYGSGTSDCVSITLRALEPINRCSIILPLPTPF